MFSTTTDSHPHKLEHIFSTPPLLEVFPAPPISTDHAEYSWWTPRGPPAALSEATRVVRMIGLALQLFYCKIYLKNNWKYVGEGVVFLILCPIGEEFDRIGQI